MRKYAIILLVFTLMGLTLTVQFFTQDRKLDQTVFLQTTESIRNLQTLDKNILLLLNQSRFNGRFDHHRLRDTNLNLSVEFDNLRFDALFEEIESSENLSTTVTAFETAFTNRAELLEQYISVNTQITESLLIANRSSRILQKNEQVKRQPDLFSSIVEILSDLFDLTLGNGLAGELILIEPDFKAPRSIATQMLDLKSAVRTINQQYPIEDALFEKLFSINSNQLLNQIESDYADYHKGAIEGSNSLRSALLIYGVALLLALVYFAYKIWRNYALLEQQVADRTAEIKAAYEELRESQEQLIQNEKMASLGQMVAGVAHEINTPLGYVTSNASSLKLNLADLNILVEKLHSLANVFRSETQQPEAISKKLTALIDADDELDANELINESLQLLDDGLFGLSEMTKLVKSLKDFARLDRQATECIDVHDCLESSLTIASNPIKENNVTIVREFTKLPTISCSPSKINHLFLNILTNACQAMQDRNGTLTVKTSTEGESIRIDFIDQGIGMDDETRRKMFDPFFTSKEIGQGTGMGMSIAFKIIDEHKGKIDVSSVLDEGTTVSVILPSNTL